jgi:hypothetical protein
VADLQLKFTVRELLERAIAGDYTHAQLAELHKLSYVVGRSFVRLKCAKSRLPLTLLGLDEADVVHDGIADLFTRTPSGELVEFSRYFENRRVSPSSLPDDMLLVHLRNLVFTVVSDSIFRMLNEADPVLGRVIRNIKLAVRESERWSIETRFDDRVLVLGRSGRSGARRPAPSMAAAPIAEDELERVVHSIIGRYAQVPSLLAGLALEFDRADAPPGPIPLVCFAVMVKVGYEKVHVHAEFADPSETPMLSNDLRLVISECCDSVDRAMRARYVGKGKVCDGTFSAYISALEGHFKGHCAPALADGSPCAGTYYEALRITIPTLTKEQYAADHRPTFEYLGKLVKQNLREKLEGT